MLSLMNMSSYHNGNIFYLHIKYLEDNLPLQNKKKIRYKPNSVDKVASAWNTTVRFKLKHNIVQLIEWH